VSKNELNSKLRQLSLKDSFDENAIRALVAEGANVNCVIGGESLLMEVVFSLELDADISVVQLLVELGADVNFESDDGLTALSDACTVCNSKLVEFLLSQGANPNIVIDQRESLLDMVEFDLFVCESEKIRSYSDKPYELMAREITIFIENLKAYGAKKLNDLYTTEIKDWLVIFANQPTGLITKQGYIDIQDISYFSTDIKDKFTGWLNANWDSWPNGSISDKPRGFDRELHNIEGKSLALEIKKNFGNTIEVKYLCVSSEDEDKGVRNVESCYINL